jgi:hypothetical protein
VAGAATRRAARRGTDVLTEFQNAFYTFEPTTDRRRIVHAEAMRAFNELVGLHALMTDSSRR